MSEVISIINEKGGVGKTTSTINIAEILAKAGYEVLVVDLDPQMNLTKVLGNNISENIETDYTSLFCSEIDMDTLVTNFVKYTDYENICIIPATREHADIIYSIHNAMQSNQNVALYFRKNLGHLKEMFDYILIDNSPFKSTLTTCSICASDNILTPIQADNFSYDGLFNLIQSISELNQKYSLDVKFLGIFMTRVVTRSNLYKGLFESYQNEFGDKFIPISISNSIILGEINTNFTPLLSYDKKSNAAKEYIELVNYIGLLDNKHYKKLIQFVKCSKNKKGGN